MRTGMCLGLGTCSNEVLSTAFKSFLYGMYYTYIRGENLDLPIPTEPTHLKREWGDKLRGKGGEASLIRWNIEQGTWITAPLWSKHKWKKELMKNGITWPKFMHLYKYVSYHFINWAEDRETWGDVIRRFIGMIEEEIKRGT